MVALGDSERAFHLLSNKDPGYKLHYTDASVREGINQLFLIELVAIAETDEADFDSLLGSHVTIHTKFADEFTPRYFDGLVTEATWEGQTHEGQRYRFMLEPWLAIAARRKTQRIFHNKDVLQILRDVFDHYGTTGSGLYRIATSRSYPQLEYTVQYDESDLNFARRLMEQFGISFYFEHAENEHTLVLFDTKDSLSEVPGGKIELLEHTSVHESEGVNLNNWIRRRGHVTGSVRLIDYDFKEPRKRLDFDKMGARAYDLGGLESFEYAGGFTTEGDGKEIVKRRLEAHESQDARVLASGLAYKLAPGMTFRLKSLHSETLNDTRYMCVSASHILPSQTFGTSPSGGNVEYRGTYEMTPYEEPFAPPVITPKPRIMGPQTALVDGPKTTDCDEYGRILVKFHWDVATARSMRCRVSQSWAGGSFGAFVLPRKGMEVIVEFINGDPDQPIVTGCVYNGANETPYDLPANSTRSTFKTKSVEGSGFNELRFEDKAGEEEVFLKGEKDLNLYVQNNSTEHVLNDKVLRADNDLAVSATNNVIHVADNAMQILVGQGQAEDNVTGSEDGAYEASAIETEDIEGASDSSGDLGIIASGAMGLSVDGDYAEAIGGSKTSEVGSSQEISTGTSYSLEAGTSIALEAATEITLTVGGSSITIDNTGVTISGPIINISSDATTDISSGAMTTVASDGIVQVDASLVKLN